MRWATRTVAQDRGLQSHGGGWLRVRSVPVDVVRGPLCGVAGPEVGAVAVEDVDPLAAGVVDGLGDEVDDVAVAAAGHADVRRGGAGRFAEREVGGADGLSLCSVGGRGEGELDVLVDVLGGQGASARAAGDEQAAVIADPGHGPGVAVGDCEVAVVASGGDPVAETDPLSTTRDGLTNTVTRLLTRVFASAVAAVADRRVECADLVAGVGDDEMVTVIGMGGADGGQGCGAFDLAGMDDDLAAFKKCVEDLTRPLTSAHEQAEFCVGGIAEPVDRLELVVRFGAHPACGEVEDPAAADGRELVAVAEKRDDCVRSVGDGEQRAGGVLVEHAGLVNEEDIAGEQACACLWRGVGLRPVPVLVPAVAVLVDEPGGGEGVSADLLAGGLGGLERGRDDHESTIGVVEYVARSGQGGGLAGARGAFDHEQAGVAGEGRDDAPLPRVEVRDAGNDALIFAFYLNNSGGFMKKWRQVKVDLPGAVAGKRTGFFNSSPSVSIRS